MYLVVNKTNLFTFILVHMPYDIADILRKIPNLILIAGKQKMRLMATATKIMSCNMIFLGI